MTYAEYLKKNNASGNLMQLFKEQQAIKEAQARQQAIIDKQNYDRLTATPFTGATGVQTPANVRGITDVNPATVNKYQNVFGTSTALQSAREAFTATPTNDRVNTNVPAGLPPTKNGEYLQETTLRAATPTTAPKQSFLEKAARAVLPTSIENYLGMNPNSNPGIQERITTAEDAKQSYFRTGRQESNVAQVTDTKEEYVAPTSLLGKAYEVVKYKGYVPDMLNSIFKPVVGTVAEQMGLYSDNPELRSWGEKFADQTKYKSSLTAYGQSKASIPPALKGGLLDPRYYAKTITDAVGFFASILGTSALVTATTKNPVAGFASGVAVGTAFESTNAYSDMIDKGVAPDKANVAATIYGIASSIIENATGLKPAGGLKSLTEDFAVEAAKNPRYIKFLKTWAEEGILEEGGQQLIQNLITKVVSKDQSITEGVAESMIGGLVGALPMTGATHIYNASAEKKYNAAKAEEDRKKEEQRIGFQMVGQPVDNNVPKPTLRESFQASQATQEPQSQRLLSAPSTPLALPSGNQLLLGPGTGRTEVPATTNTSAEFQIIDPRQAVAIKAANNKLIDLQVKMQRLLMQGDAAANRGKLLSVQNEITTQKIKISELEKTAYSATGPVSTRGEDRFAQPVSVPVEQTTVQSPPKGSTVAPAARNNETSTNTPAPVNTSYGEVMKKFKAKQERDTAIKKVKVTPKVEPKKIKPKYDIIETKLGNNNLFTIVNTRTGDVVKDFMTNEVPNAYRAAEKYIKDLREGTITEGEDTEPRVVKNETVKPVEPTRITEVKEVVQKPIGEMTPAEFSEYLKNKNKVQNEKLKQQLAEEKSVKDELTKQEKKDLPKKRKMAETIVKERTANNILFDYDVLSDKSEVTDEDIMELQKLDDEYLALTGRTIAEYNISDNPDLESSSKARKINPIEDYDSEEYLNEEKIWWSRGKKKLPKVIVGREEIRTESLEDIDAEVNAINSGRLSFNVGVETLKVVRDFGARLVSNVARTEGHSMGNIIGHDSLNNPLLLAHELTHNIMGDYRKYNGILKANLFGNKSMTDELRKMYFEYYPGAPKNHDTVSDTEIFNEGLSEFIRQHLKNPTQITKDYPVLSKQFLGTGRYSNKNINKLYNDINKIIYIYQNISLSKQALSLRSLDLDLKKFDVKSILVGKAGRIFTRSSDYRHTFRVIDDFLKGVQEQDKKRPFIIDKDGVSIEMMASMSKPSMTVALETLDKNAKSTNLLSSDGKSIEEVLDFSIGELIDEANKSGDIEAADLYIGNKEYLREREWLRILEQKLSDLEQKREFMTTKKDANELEKEIKETKEGIENKKGVIATQPMTEEQERKIMEENRAVGEKYEQRLVRIFDLILDLNVRSGKLSQEQADEWRSIEGYAPRQRSIVSDIDEYLSGSGKRSANSPELHLKRGSNKPVKNVFTVLPKMYSEAVKKYTEQNFYNALYEKLDSVGLVRNVGEGKMIEKSTYTYAKDGKIIQYKISDPFISESIEAEFGSNAITNPFWSMLDVAGKGTARNFQKFTTQLNFYFAFFKNLALDSWTAPLLSETGYIPFYSQMKMYAESKFNEQKRKDIKSYKSEYALLTGGDSGIYELQFSQDNPIDVIKKVSKEKGKIAKSSEAAFNRYKKVLNITEKFTRETEYIRARQQGNDVANSFEMSRNISGSFHKVGSTTKNVVKYTPFVNSGIQIGSQIVKALGQSRKAKTVGALIAISSSIQLINILRLIKELDDAEDDEEKKQIAYEKIYRYLDKTTFEKFNYAPVGDKYKFAITPIFSAPGTMIGLKMLSDRVPEYKVNWGSSLYEVVGGVLPNQMTPDLESADTVFESFIGSIVGAFPIVGAGLATAGIRTFPLMSELETSSMQDKEARDRYKEDTNNLAVLLGRITNISPIRLEQVIAKLGGTGGTYASDLLGALLIPDATKEELGLVDKTMSELLFSNPTKSAISQKQGTLKNETKQKFYSSQKDLITTKSNLERGLNKFGSNSDILDGSNMSQEDIDKYNLLATEYQINEAKITEMRKIESAINVVSKFEVRKKDVPIELKNAINKYILAINSGHMTITESERKMVLEAGSFYNKLSDLDWSKVPDAK